ncbi:conserved protein of unknown function [Tenacibaculum sp. 190130A14a]|uniref:DUF6265 domain-containing protein n=1 Tax=Tenacibaculum polynesiense TaxID=3137857 RepID=A0ABP1EU45_9FLAO
MRLLLALLIITTMASCKHQSKEQKPKWLIGKWKRLNNKPNHTTYEFWNKDLSGLGFTLKQKDTTFKEILHIITKNDSLFLQVTGVNQSPTLFAITQQTDTSFTAENHKNEFPKIITYWKSKEYLKAKVANEEFHIDFVFQSLD